MSKEQSLLKLLHNLDIIELSAVKKDKHGNIFHFYNQKRNLLQNEVNYLVNNGINIKQFIAHNGKHNFYILNDLITTGHNHPFMKKNNNTFLLLA